MSFEANGPKGSLIRIEIPGGDLTNAKIINTVTGEELDNVAALKIKGDINSPTAQAEVWLKLVNVDIAIDAYLKDAELLTAAFEQTKDLKSYDPEKRRVAFAHLPEVERNALIWAIEEANRKRKIFAPSTYPAVIVSDDPTYRKMVDDTCSCFRCQDVRYNEQLKAIEEETNDD